mgnify:CR=1 FL=1
MQLPDFAEYLGGGIIAIDTGFHRPRFDAAGDEGLDALRTCDLDTALRLVGGDEKREARTHVQRAHAVQHPAVARGGADA